MLTRLVRPVKRRLVPKGKRETRILAGAFHGLVMPLDLASQSLIKCGLYEREVYPCLRELTRGIRSAIDVGAADGLYTLKLVRDTDADPVVAVEPLDEGRAALARMLTVNRLEARRVRMISDYVDDAHPLDRFADLPSPCFVKMDIEGAEADALLGAEHFAAHVESRWLIETHSAEQERRCLAWFADHRFVTRVIPNAWWRMLIPEGRPIAHNRWLAAWLVAPSR